MSKSLRNRVARLMEGLEQSSPGITDQDRVERIAKLLVRAEMYFPDDDLAALAARAPTTPVSGNIEFEEQVCRVAALLERARGRRDADLASQTG